MGWFCLVLYRLSVVNKCIIIPICLVISPGSIGRPLRGAGGFCRLGVSTVMEQHIGSHTPQSSYSSHLVKNTYSLRHSQHERTAYFG